MSLSRKPANLCRRGVFVWIQKLLRHAKVKIIFGDRVPSVHSFTSLFNPRHKQATATSFLQEKMADFVERHGANYEGTNPLGFPDEIALPSKLSSLRRLYKRSPEKIILGKYRAPLMTLKGLISFIERAAKSKDWQSAHTIGDDATFEDLMFEAYKQMILREEESTNSLSSENISVLVKQAAKAFPRKSLSLALSDPYTRKVFTPFVRARSNSSYSPRSKYNSEHLEGIHILGRGEGILEESSSVISMLLLEEIVKQHDLAPKDSYFHVFKSEFIEVTLLNGLEAAFVPTKDPQNTAAFLTLIADGKMDEYLEEEEGLFPKVHSPYLESTYFEGRAGWRCQILAINEALKSLAALGS